MVGRVPGGAELQGEEDGGVGMAGEVVYWPEKLAGDPSAAARSGDVCSRRSAAVEIPKKNREDASWQGEDDDRCPAGCGRLTLLAFKKVGGSNGGGNTAAWGQISSQGFGNRGRG